MTAPRRLPYDFDVVSRRVNRSAMSLPDTVDVSAAEGSRLRFDGPFVATTRDLAVWRTTGRLYGEGARLMRYTRVRIEFATWSHRATEVRMRPITRRIPNWGTRRQERYFETAHRMIDELARALDAVIVRHDAIERQSERRLRLARAGSAALAAGDDMRSMRGTARSR
jgi:hypothetical protein